MKPGDNTFQSTPSVWRETYNASEYDLMWGISIHSLRMEGDSRHCACGRSQLHFNPLPPHGGRLPFSNRRFTDSTFQSTPSAWRETHWHNGQSITRQFQSTPSAWRETVSLMDSARPSRDFNPLPPHGGRPVCMMLFTAKKRISIHSLRMEGDTVSRSEP